MKMNKKWINSHKWGRTFSTQNQVCVCPGKKAAKMFSEPQNWLMIILTAIRRLWGTKCQHEILQICSQTACLILPALSPHLLLYLFRRQIFSIWQINLSNTSVWVHESVCECVRMCSCMWMFVCIFVTQCVLHLPVKYDSIVLELCHIQMQC